MGLGHSVVHNISDWLYMYVLFCIHWMINFFFLKNRLMRTHKFSYFPIQICPVGVSQSKILFLRKAGESEHKARDLSLNLLLDKVCFLPILATSVKTKVLQIVI